MTGKDWGLVPLQAVGNMVPRWKVPEYCFQQRRGGMDLGLTKQGVSPRPDHKGAGMEGEKVEPCAVVALLLQ